MTEVAESQNKCWLQNKNRDGYKGSLNGPRSNRYYVSIQGGQIACPCRPPFTHWPDITEQSEMERERADKYVANDSDIMVNDADQQSFSAATDSPGDLSQSLSWLWCQVPSGHGSALACS